MLDNCQSAQERWGGVSDIIDRWLKERQELLVSYCHLSEPAVVSDEIARANFLRAFCQILVDYVSAGHFEVYEQLIKEGEEFDDQEALRTAAPLYKTVDGTTEDILDFNDKYQETDDLGTIDKDLSSLGEWLETRFEAEDKMIEVLHTAHKGQVA